MCVSTTLLVEMDGYQNDDHEYLEKGSMMFRGIFI